MGFAALDTFNFDQLQLLSFFKRFNWLCQSRLVDIYWCLLVLLFLDNNADLIEIFFIFKK